MSAPYRLVNLTVKVLDFGLARKDSELILAICRARFVQPFSPTSAP